MLLIENCHKVKSFARKPAEDIIFEDKHVSKWQMLSCEKWKLDAENNVI